MRMMTRMKVSSLSELIQRERREQGWDQAELAHRLGDVVGQQTISGWETGRSRPRREAVAQLAALFGLNANDLLKLAGYSAHADRPREPAAPVRPLLTILPVWELAPDKFEELIAEVAQALFPELTVARFGGQGHEQYGVDVVAEQASRYVKTFQCKRHQRFGPGMVTAAVSAVTIDADEHYLVLSRRDASPAARNEMQKHPKWTLWDAQDLSRQIRQLPDATKLTIVDTFFPGWREAFLGIAEPGPWLDADEFYRPLAAGSIYTQEWHLVGRQRELTDVGLFLNDPDPRLGLVIGRGGIGKSRLLRAIADVGRDRGVPVTFLKQGAQPKAQDYERLPRTDPHVVVIDDAQDRDDLIAVVGEVLRSNPQAKVLLALRPYARGPLDAGLRQLGVRGGDVPQWELSDLSRDDAEVLAREALGPDAPDHLAQRLGRLTVDCPFITVIAGVLIRRGDLDPACLDHEETVRNEVLKTFRDVVVADPLEGDSEVRREVLDSLAALQPVRTDDDAFQSALETLVGKPYDRVLRHIRALEAAGVVLRRGSSIRVVPDLLGDVVLTEACYDATARTSTRFLERAWQVAQGPVAQHVFINACRVDWQIRHDDPLAHGLTDSLWRTIDGEARAAGIHGRINLLKLMQKVAYYEPTRSLKLARWLVANPTDRDEETDSPLAMLYPFSYGDVVNEIPAVLRACAYNFNTLADAVNLLWQLAQADPRETNPHPGHPVRVLRDLAAIEPGKPLEYNDAIIDLASAWFSSAEPQRVSPFDVLEPMLATEGTDDSSSGLQVRMRPYLINPEVLQPLRDRVVGLALQELGSPDIKRAARAVRLIGSAVHYPIGLFGRAVPAQQLDAWTPRFVATLNQLADTLRKTPVDPVVGVAIRQALHWHTHYSETATREAAQNVLRALPESLETQLATALFDGWGHLLEHEGLDYAELDAISKAGRERVASELVAAMNEDAIVDLLLVRLGAQRDAFDRGAGNPGPFVGALIEACPEVGLAICARVTPDSPSALMEALPVAIAVVAETRGDPVMPAVRSLLEEDSPIIRRTVAQALGWNRGRRQLLTGEFDLLLELADDPDPVVRRFLVLAAQRLAAADPSLAATLITSVPFADSGELADEVFQTFAGQGDLRWSQLRKPQQDGLLTELILCPSIEGYWVTEFLSELTQHDPKKVVTLLIQRVERWEADPELADYRPLPFQWSKPLQARVHAGFPDMLRAIRDWIAERPNSWFRIEDGGRLFAAVAQGFDESVMAILDEAVASGDAAQLVALAAILRRAPHTFAFGQHEFLTKVLHAAAAVSDDSADRIAGALHSAVVSGARSGTPGEPNRRDLDQLNNARAVADQMPRGSIEERFYRSLELSAQQTLEWHAQRDEQLLDGRDW